VVMTTHLDADAAHCDIASHLRGGRVVPNDTPRHCNDAR